MSVEALNYFLDNYGSFNKEENFKGYFDFLKLNNVNSQSGSSLSGVLINSVAYVSGSGAVFSNNNPSIQLVTPDDAFENDFSLLFVNKKPNNKKSILFNCLNSGSDEIIKGFSLGYNNVGNVFLEHYTNLGWQTYTTDFFAKEKHSLYLTKSSNSISVGYYNLFERNVINESFDVNPEFWFASDQYYIGKGTGNLTNVYYDYNTGSGVHYSLDQFLVFNTPLTNSDIEIINSGFAYYYTGTAPEITYITGEDYTGTVNSNLTLLTGITGWQITATGVVVDDFGDTATGYSYLPLTGIISGSGVNNLTGLVVYAETGVSEQILTLDENYIKSFYSDRFSLLKTKNSGDVLNVCYETGELYSLGYKDDATFNSVFSWFRTYAPEEQPIIVYVNGLSQFSGDLYNSGTIYNPNLILENDYYKTGLYLDFQNKFAENDNLYYRGISGVIYHTKTGSGVNILPSGLLNSGKYQIFSNGLKLTDRGLFPSGASYFVTNELLFTGESLYFSGDGLSFSPNQLLFSGESLYFSGDGLSFGKNYVLFGDYILSGDNKIISYKTGSLSVVIPLGIFQEKIENSGISTNNFKYNEYYTQFYLNGKFQIKDEDYIISSPTTKLNNEGNFERGTFNILSINQNGDDLFFE